MSQACILDYGSGNVRSVFNMLKGLDPGVVVSNDAAAIRAATHLILPGVGAFGASMEKIRTRIPLDVLEQEVRAGKPFLGICVGFQVLADRGHEFGTHEGLGWLPGDVARLESGDHVLPHVGWNAVELARTSPLLQDLGESRDFYFVHSFAVTPRDAGDVVGMTEYGARFCSVASRGNIHGVQFHPEKSQRAGSILLRNFLALR